MSKQFRLIVALAATMFAPAIGAAIYKANLSAILALGFSADQPACVVGAMLATIAILIWFWGWHAEGGAA